MFAMMLIEMLLLILPFHHPTLLFTAVVITATSFCLNNSNTATCVISLEKSNHSNQVLTAYLSIMSGGFLFPSSLFRNVDICVLQDYVLENST